MLHELVTYLTTPCPAHVRRLRYLYEVIAMRARHRRHRAAWAPHLENTRAFLLAAADRCEGRGAVAIYGAGLLLDVPLAELASRFGRVHLLDIVFLREVRRQAGRFGNVALVEHDATGLAEPLARVARRRAAALPEPAPALPACVQGADLVVSLNILSQLAVMPRAHVIRERPDLDDGQLDAWCGRIAAAHLGLLRSLERRVCLVADHAYAKRDRAGAVVESGSTIYDLPLPSPDAAWTWQLAPLGEGDRTLSTGLLVGAWHLR